MQFIEQSRHWLRVPRGVPWFFFFRIFTFSRGEGLSSDPYLGKSGCLPRETVSQKDNFPYGRFPEGRYPEVNFFLLFRGTKCSTMGTCLLGNWPLRNCPSGKLSSGKLSLWETSYWDKTNYEKFSWKLPTGNYPILNAILRIFTHVIHFFKVIYFI